MKPEQFAIPPALEAASDADVRLHGQARSRGTRIVRQNSIHPRWDPGRGELWFEGVLAKSFRKYARNQQLLLQAFEDANWSHEIEDPLPVSADIVPQGRLRETVKRLNRSVAPGTIRFGLCCCGRLAYWRKVHT